MTVELYYNTELGAVIDRNKDTRCIPIYIAIRVFHIWQYIFGVSLHPYMLVLFGSSMGDIGWSAGCACGISLSYTLTFFMSRINFILSMRSFITSRPGLSVTLSICTKFHYHMV